MKNKKKAQGAPEYLIIIAGVLAIAAIVVFFLTQSAGTGRKRNIETNCQQAASQCALKLQIDTNFNCDVMCAEACRDPSNNNYDIMGEVEIADGATECPSGADACEHCSAGEVSQIIYSI